MGNYTKLFFEGVIKSYDGRIYEICLPNEDTAILKHSTVHKMCSYPETMMEGDHLKVGSTIHLCRIVKPDKISILPDHRHYIAPEKSGAPSESSIKDFLSLLSEANKREDLKEVVTESMKLFSLGLISSATILLSTLLRNLNKR